MSIDNSADAETATSPFLGPVPQPGDRVRVTRTRVDVFEGFWVKAEDPHTTGDHFVTVAAEGVTMRVRDRGPVTFGKGHDGEYIESDQIEVLESRDGAPFDHLVADWAELQRTRQEASRLTRSERREMKRNTRRRLAAQKVAQKAEKRAAKQAARRKQDR